MKKDTLHFLTPSPPPPTPARAHWLYLFLVVFIFVILYWLSRTRLFCDPMDSPGSSVLESSPPRDRLCLLRLLHWQADSLPLRHLESPGDICIARELFPPISSYPAVYRSRSQCRIKLLAQDPRSSFLIHRVAWMRQETIWKYITYCLAHCMYSLNFVSMNDGWGPY